MNQLVNIKPISVNQAYQGRRFKTDKYKSFEREFLLKLKGDVVPDGKLKVNLIFGFSSKLADVDNPVKQTLDVLQKKYGFNDRNIYELNIKKEDVRKGFEFIDISIESLDQNKNKE